MTDRQGRGRPPLSFLRWQVVGAGVGMLLVAGFILQSASAYETVLIAAGGGRYSEAVVGGPRYINPLLSQYNRVDADIASLVFSGLTRLDGCGNVHPDLAASWTVSEDGRQYTFQLREDASWHDGVPVVARDVVLTIQLVQDPDYPGPPSISRLWRDVEVEELSEREVRFELPESYAPFLAHTNLGLLPSHLLAGIAASELTKLPFNRLPVGTGPFQVVESDTQHVLLSVNQEYYGREDPYLEEVEFRFYRDLGEALRAYERGEVLAISDVSPEYLPEIASRAALNVYSAPLARMAIVLLNLKSPDALFLGDRTVRQALMYGLDRQGLVARALEGQGLVAHAPYSVCSWALDPAGSTYSFDPQLARELLEETGWQDSDGDGIRDKDGDRLAFRVLVPDERGAKAVAQEVARQWRSIGVEAEVLPMSFAEMVGQHLQGRSYDAALVELSLEGDPDPYVLWHSSQIDGGGQNYSAFVSREADGLLERARRVWDLEERRELYRQFQTVFTRELPALPLYYPVYTFAVSEAVHGVQLGPLMAPSDRFEQLPEWYVNYRRLRVKEGAIEAE